MSEILARVSQFNRVMPNNCHCNDCYKLFMRLPVI